MSPPPGSSRFLPTLAAGVLLGLTACAGSPDPAADRGRSPSTAEPAEPTPGSAPAPPQATRSARTLRPPSAAEQAALDERLRQAAWANEMQRAEQLIARGADVNATDDTEQSAYLIATSEGYLDLLRLTLANGADIDAKDRFDGTGLIRAAERGHHPVVELLLEEGIERDHVNRLGYQAIHEAVWLGEDTARYAQTIRSLAEGGAQLDRPSVREGLTPLQMAEQRGYERLEGVLRDALARSARTGPDAG